MGSNEHAQQAPGPKSGRIEVCHQTTIIQLLQKRHFADHTSEPVPFPLLVVASKILNLSPGRGVARPWLLSGSSTSLSTCCVLRPASEWPLGRVW